MHFRLPHSQSQSMVSTRRRSVDYSSLFPVGAKVEVSSNEEGFRGAWYGATIYGPPKRSPRNTSRGGGGGGGGVLVEYETLLSEGNPSEFLIEFIELQFVRPVPPDEEVKSESFEVLDVVDAFHRDGWWKGVVTEVVDRPASKNGKGERLYNVVFQDPCHQIMFRASKMRFHLEWVNGSWTKPSKKKRMEGLIFSKGMEVEVNLEKNSSKEAWCPATVVDEVGFCSFLVTCISMESQAVSSPMKITVDCFHIRPRPHKADIKSFSMLESVDAFCDSRWIPGYIIEFISSEKYTVCLQNDLAEKEFSLSELRPYLYWKGGKWVSYSRHAKPKCISLGEVNSELVDKNAVMYLGTDPGNGTTEKQHPRLLNSCSKSERKGVKRSSPGSGVEQLCRPRKSTRINSKDSSSPPQRATDLQLVGASIKRRVSSVAEIGLRKGIDRNGKNKGKDKHVPEAGISDIDENIHTSKISELELISQSPAGVTDGVTNDTENQGPAIIETDMQMIKYVDHSVLLLCAANLTNQDSAVEEVEPLLITYGASDVDERNSAFQEGDLPMLPCAEPVDKEGNEPEVAAGEMNGEVDMVQDIELPTITSGKPTGESLCDGEKLCGQPSEEESGGPVLAPADGIPSQLVENDEIPFVKTPAIWKPIESLEPFQLLPQKPHFRPLINCREENREAVAISAMVLFSEMVERTSKLQVDDPSDVFVRYLESLSDLDSYGFNVKPVVDRIEKLLEIKQMHGEFQDTSKQLQLKIADNRTEMRNLAEEFDEADKKFKELQEKRASVAAMLSAVEAEIGALELEAGALEENDAMAEQEFRSIVASPLGHRLA